MANRNANQKGEALTWLVHLGFRLTTAPQLCRLGFQVLHIAFEPVGSCVVPFEEIWVGDMSSGSPGAIKADKRAPRQANSDCLTKQRRFSPIPYLHDRVVPDAPPHIKEAGIAPSRETNQPQWDAGCSLMWPVPP